MTHGSTNEYFHCPGIECVVKAEASGAASFDESRFPIKNH
jgi:hypothetical protein